MTLQKPQISEYRELKNYGVDVDKHNKIAFNSGSETAKHLAAKSIAGKVALENGYRVDSEVPVENTNYPDGEIDLLIWGHPSRLTLAVELETSPTEDIKSEKVEKYVKFTAVDDLCLINVTELDLNILNMYEQLAVAMGLPV